MITLSGADQSLSQQLQAYDDAWSALGRKLPDLRSSIAPTTISWKVADKAALFHNLKELAPLIEQVHIGTVNDRYIASAVFHDPFFRHIRILKILERRQGSDDPLGLDSIDYLGDDLASLESVLEDQGVKRESNDMHSWLSLRFGPELQFEAKIVDHLVLAVAIKELEASNQQILKSIV